MRFFLPTVAILGALFAQTTSVQAQQQQGPRPTQPTQPKISTVYEFGEGTWPENLAVRSNGKVLVNMLEAPHLFMINPETKNATLIHESTAGTSLFGITEIQPDLFAFAVGNYSITTGPVDGTSSIWTVDFRHYEKTKEAPVKKVAAFPEAGLVNGITAISPWSSKIIVTDSAKALLYALDYNTGAYETVLAGASLGYAADAALKIGVNGVRTYQNYLYYTNTDQQLLYRVHINLDGHPTDQPEAVGSVWGDDFSISHDGNVAYVGGVLNNTVERVDIKKNKTTVIAGSRDSLDVAGVTSTALGRTKKDRNTLYMSSEGGLASPVDGKANPGRLLAIELDC